MIRKVNETTVIKLESAERCCLEAYLDQRGIPTIGYGHTHNVKMGDTCTQHQAEMWLDEDLALAEYAVANYTHVDLNDNQFGALVMFTYNVGTGVYERSPLLAALNQGDYDAVPIHLKKYNKYEDPHSALLIPSLGLTRRRQIEIDLWNTPDGATT